ncbi:hypothetical protein PTSG_05169 [Salpingoeca rosetta]|uniref:SSD domain-containing protein n=1 Tax=Salpingoeca rosetta (strain ATCC 50818 / BSB-021) TaxID=946362 RepID=F2UAQ0_SALR5|nr:uncharacterized protein PTSG_05169 [Salpingoeca rosetta]EGD73466.1 hypothetical protein PTSG_05169 [Salpingoeca rosetta]|eukprot:XP_004993748.1 hypothetical protein PTSG_05169 [Salpingoeca rosetta]
MGLSKKLFVGTEELFVRYAGFVGRNRNGRILALVGVLLIVAFLPGFAVVDEESRIEKLYVHERSRLHGEYEFFRDHFGGLSRVQATIHQSTSGETATKETLDSILTAITPMYKEDETNLCNFYDGVATSRPALCNNTAYASNIYCSCEEIAGSPNQISITWPANGRDETITQKDLCEAPPVPDVLKSATELSYEPTDPGATSSATFLEYEDLVYTFRSGSLRNDPVYRTYRATAKQLCVDEIQRQWASRAYEDITAAVIQCYARLNAEVFGPVYGVNTDATLDTAGLQALWELAVRGETNSTVLEFAYNNATTGAALGTQAVQAWNQTQETVNAASFLVAQATAAGFGATRAQFAQEGRIMSYGYAETAHCVAQYQRENRAAILAAVGPSVMQSRDLEDNGVKDWDDAGLAAAFASLEAAAVGGANITTDTAAQGAALAAYAGASVEPFNSTITQQEQALGITFNTTGLAAARQEAETRFALNLAMNVTTFTAADVTAVENAYSTAAPGASNASEAAATVVTAVAVEFQLAQAALPAVVEAVLTSLQAPSLLFPDIVTLNGTVRPLPRGWGIDRFPCSRSTGLDVFREGDFDLPYRMKQLDRMSRYMYYFYTLPYFQDAVEDANCLETSLLAPLRNGIYLEGLQNYPALYQQINFDAIAAAEAAYLANAADTDAAEQAAKDAFVANGFFIGIDDPFNPVNLTTPAGQAFLNTTSGTTVLDAIARAVGTSATSVVQVDSQFVQIVEAFVGFGFWYRPTYGSHPLATATLSDAEIVAVYDSAIAAAPNPDITVAECIAGNTDASTLQGDPVLSCFLTWSGLKLPYELALGPLTFENATASVPSAASGRLVSVRSQRTGGNNYNSEHHVFQDSIDELLDKTTTKSEREAIHRRFERAVADHYDALWKRNAGTGFADGEEFEDQRFYFTLERSIPDTVAEAGKIEPGLLVGGFLCLLAYVMLVSANFRNAIYSHAWIAFAGVVLITASTAAALGFSAYCGIDFTPISSNVVPFVALGVGIDDVLVILAAFGNAVLRPASDPADVIKTTMADAGPSVSFTSLTNFVAFFIASATPVRVVQLFCYQMVISVALNYVLILTVFVPLLYLEARRVHAQRPEALCVCHRPGTPVPKQAHPLLDRFFSRHIGRVLMTTPARVLVLVCAAIAIGLSIWQVFDIQRGVLFSSVATEDSYQYDFAVRLESDFTMYNGYLVTESEDFPAAQQNILNAVASLQQSPRVADSAPVASIFWLHSMLLSQTGNSTQPVAEDDFYPQFSEWLAALGITFLPDLYCIDSRYDTPVSCYDIVGAFSTPRAFGSNANVRLAASRGLFYISNVRYQDDYLDAIRSTRSYTDAASDAYDNEDDPDYRSFVISYVHIFWEQYLHSYRDLYVVVGLCLLGIFVATFLFQFSFITSLLLCIVIFIVDLEVYALLPALGLTLNAFSTTNLCLAIGMAVEFTAHVAHQFLTEAGESRPQRVRATLRFMGTPLFNGAMSSLIAVLFIVGSRTGFIRDYYFSMFFATIVIAFLNGIILLPVLLSLVGPAPLDERHKAAQELADDNGNNGDDAGGGKAYDGGEHGGVTPSSTMELVGKSSDQDTTTAPSFSAAVEKQELDEEEKAKEQQAKEQQQNGDDAAKQDVVHTAIV